MVIKKYKKYEVYEKELKDYVEGQQKQEETIRGRLMKLQTENQNPNANHDDLEETMKAEKRKLEDLGHEDQDDILACVHFLLVDVLAARQLLSDLLV